jgi:hypothetical protein
VCVCGGACTQPAAPTPLKQHCWPAGGPPCSCASLGRSRGPWRTLPPKVRTRSDLRAVCCGLKRRLRRCHGRKRRRPLLGRARKRLHCRRTAQSAVRQDGARSHPLLTPPQLYTAATPAERLPRAAQTLRVFLRAFECSASCRALPCCPIFVSIPFQARCAAVEWQPTTFHQASTLLPLGLPRSAERRTLGAFSRSAEPFSWRVRAQGRRAPTPKYHTQIPYGTALGARHART